MLARQWGGKRLKLIFKDEEEMFNMLAEIDHLLKYPRDHEMLGIEIAFIYKICDAISAKFGTPEYIKYLTQTKAKRRELKNERKFILHRTEEDKRRNSVDGSKSP
jgi:hypothetical protein